MNEMKVLAWKKQNRSFFPCFFAMILDAMLSFVPVLPMYYLPHFVDHLPMERIAQRDDKSSHKHHIVFYPNLVMKREKNNLGIDMIDIRDSNHMTYLCPSM